MAILLLMVDSDEQTPLGVYPNWREALAAARADAFRDGEDWDDDAEDEFRAAFEDAFEVYERAPSSEGMDLQFSHPRMSVDYRLVQVSVFGEV